MTRSSHAAGRSPDQGRTAPEPGQTTRPPLLLSRNRAASGRVLTPLAFVLAIVAFALSIVVLRYAVALALDSSVALQAIAETASHLLSAQQSLASLREATALRRAQSLALQKAVQQAQDRLGRLIDSTDALTQSAPPAEQARWLEHPGNPVFRRDGPVAFPWLLYDAHQFGEGPEGPFYKMWYDRVDDGVTPLDNEWIGLAVSSDGVHWNDLGELRRPDVNRSDPQDHRRYFGHPCVLYDAHGFARGQLPYRIYYPGWGGMVMEESPDGLVWEPTDLPLFDWNDVPEDPTFRGPMHGLYVIYDNGGSPTDPRDDMFFGWIDYSGRPFIVCSRDGVQWRMPGTLLFDGFGDGMVTSQFSVLRGRGGLLHIFYSYGDNSFSSPAPAGEGIAYYQTRALRIHSLKLLPARRVLHASDEVAWRSVVTMAPCVLYDPDQFSGHGDRVHYKMWYHGVGKDNRSGIGYATFAGELPAASDR